ncbi:serine-rich adhesin for platelets-like isoform X4 [Penaeus japonicus]|uniref:serine-rich adhesin for platelets-like isoform X4 n=1 Tax=Penaeus japonicus TaxID=27405 RepID=UPI001C713A27|nr:serine-rich adhesin for platelets-like isoform X4 [Penaeus japonicus]
MKCFGDKTRTYHCKVVLLDEQELIQEIQDTTTGQDLLDTVFKHLNLLETAYFGLRYLDPTNQTHWLDPAKKVVKQLKGTSPFTLYFSVKFYAADPTKLVEEITRYQFFLQVKQDILQGRLPVSQELAAELGSYAVQSELGDYDPRRHSPGYVSEFRFMTTQTVALENKIAELHKTLVGQVPSKAEMCYLEKVKWLDMYGVDLHPVLGEDNIEYFLGLTPSGVIVLRNKAKVGNYFWPRISKVYFRGRFFMLRVRDKNNSENTYGFETPSKAACKHLWQCCVEHHAFFRLTQASGNSPAAIFSLGSKFSGRTEKEAAQEAKVGARTQPEFTRMPSRRYQRRIVEGAQDTPRVEDVEIKPETRNTVQLPTPVTSSASLTLAPRSDSPRSTRSAPYPGGVAASGGGGSVLNRSSRGESPRSVRSAAPAPDAHSYRVSRRTSSVDSQSSVDSRGHRRHRRSRGRSSDGESEASSKCSSRGHRRHRHRHHSDDSDHHRHRHRRRRHKSGGGSMVNDAQWVQAQASQGQVRGNTATVRDLTHKSGYQPSGHDTEADSHHHQHSNKKRHRKHRSRSRSPSEAKNSRLPDELRRHLEFEMQGTQGLTEAELKEIPYTKVETAKTIKIKYTSPKTKRHKSPRRSKSNSSDRKATPPADGESPPPPYTPSPTTKTNTLPKVTKESTGEGGPGVRNPEGGMVNGTLRPPGPRSVQAPTVSTSLLKSPEGSSSTRGSPSHLRGHADSSTNTLRSVKTSTSSTTGSSTPGYGYSSSHKPVMVNGPSVKALVTSSANTASPTLRREAATPEPPAFLDDAGGSFVAGNGYVPTSTAILKNSVNDRGSHFTAVLKPQPSPQSSVTSGISVGSSSVSISADSTLTSGSHNHHNLPDTTTNSTHHDHQMPSPPNSPDPDRQYHHQNSYDHHNYENYSFDNHHLHSNDCSTLSDSPEPYYSNCSFPPTPTHHDQHQQPDSYKRHQSLYPSLEPLTQHSTNILIHYHDMERLHPSLPPSSSSSLSSNSQPVPRPRSSIISSVHSSESSTHIVQNYGPSTCASNSTSTGSQYNTNSLQRSGARLQQRGSSYGLSRGVSPPPLPSPSVTTSSSSPAPSGSSCGTSATLPRPTGTSRPLMRTTGSQTNIFRTTASQTNQTNPGHKASSKPPHSSSSSNKKESETSQGIQTTNGTNLAHSALHWRVYNWDAYREEAEWSNSLGRPVKRPEREQTSTAVMSDTNGYINSFDHGPVKISGSHNGPYMDGMHINGSGNKTCLPLNGYSAKGNGIIGPVSSEFIPITNNKMSSQMNHGSKGHQLSSFQNGRTNAFDQEYISGCMLNGHVKDSGNGTGNFRTFGNGHLNGFSKVSLNGHVKDHSSDCYEVESSSSNNSKNVMFKPDSSLLRNNKNIDMKVSGNSESDNSGSDVAKGKAKKGEAGDEISTEL